MRAVKFAWYVSAGLGLWFNLCGASGPAADPAKKQAPEQNNVVVAHQEEKPKVEMTSESAAPSPLNAVSRDELGVLKQQNSDLKGFQSDLLLTVWSALGAVIVLTIALVGYGWYANFKMYERDKDLLRKELEGVVVSSEARFKSFLESSLTTHEAKTKRAVDLMQCDLKLLDAEMQINTENPSVGVTMGLGALKKAIALDSEWRIDRALSHLDEAIAGGGAFYEREITEAFELLAKVPAKLSKQADALAPKIRAAKIMPKS